MKIAFVNQAKDAIMPPKQTSVGACTYGIARSLAPAAQVLVYGLQDIHGPAPASSEHGVDFRFIPSTWLDRLLFKFQFKLAKLIPRSSPISTSRWMYPGYGCRVAIDLKKQKCDLIYLQHCSQYLSVIRSLNPKAKIVLHLHAEWFSQTDRRILEARLKHLDMLTTVSDYVTNKTKRTFPSIADRCETLYNGIDAGDFCQEPDYASRRQRRVKRILYTGAISPHKGIHVLLEAFVLVARLYPDVELDIVGPIGTYPIEENFDLADRETIERVAPFYPSVRRSLVKSALARNNSEKGTYLSYLKSGLPSDIAAKVSFHGMVERSELLARYYAANLFAFPPVWDEGFGLPPMEAMAAGLPVVATRSGAVVETVVHGQTGFLVEKHNARELADAMLVLLNDESRSEALGRAGRSRALESFTWDAVAEGLQSRHQIPNQMAMHEVNG